MAIWSKVFRGTASSAYAPGAARRINFGSYSFAAGAVNSASAWFAHGLELTPAMLPIVMAHEANTLATCQNYDATNMLITLKNVSGGNLGTVGFSYIAIG